LYRDSCIYVWYGCIVIRGVQAVPV
jgi:hypothetical protein